MVRGVERPGGGRCVADYARKACRGVTVAQCAIAEPAWEQAGAWPEILADSGNLGADSV